MLQLIKFCLKGMARAWFESGASTFTSLKQTIHGIENRFGLNNLFREFVDKCWNDNLEGKSMKKISDNFQELVDVAVEFISE